MLVYQNKFYFACNIIIITAITVVIAIDTIRTIIAVATTNFMRDAILNYVIIAEISINAMSFIVSIITIIVAVIIIIIRGLVIGQL